MKSIKIKRKKGGYSIFSRKQISSFFSRIFVIVFILVFIGAYCLAETPPNTLPSRETPVVLTVKKVGPAVVNINTERILTERVNPFGDPFLDRFFGDFFNIFPQRSYKQQSLGSGVIIDSAQKYILTNQANISLFPR